MGRRPACDARMSATVPLPIVASADNSKRNNPHIASYTDADKGVDMGARSSSANSVVQRADNASKAPSAGRE